MCAQTVATPAPRVTELCHDLFQIELPLAGHSIGHVNVYVLRAPEGVLLIDTGWSTPEALSALGSGLSQLGYSPKDVTRVLLTHLHADHCGLAGTLQRRYGTEVGIHRLDAIQLTERYVAQEPYLRATRDWLREVSAPEEVTPFALEQVRAQGRRFSACRPDFDLAEGERVAHGTFDLVVLHTPGHTPGSVSIYETRSKSLFAGDTIFARTGYSPTLRPLGLSDPLTAYLGSIRRLRGLDVEIVLPGHGETFADLTRRIGELEARHAARSADVASLVQKSPLSIWAIAVGLRRARAWTELSPSAQLSAVGEAYAYVVTV